MTKEYAFDDYIFYADSVTCAQLMRTILASDAVLREEEMAALRLPHDEFVAAAKAGALPTDFTDVHTVRESMEYEKLDFFIAPNFAGSCETMEEMVPLVTTAVIEDSFDDTTLLYLPLNNGLSLFKAAYSSPQEVVDEVREKLQKFLPDDFDYAAHLCRVLGTYFC